MDGVVSGMDLVVEWGVGMGMGGGGWVTSLLLVDRSFFS